MSSKVVVAGVGMIRSPNRARAPHITKWRGSRTPRARRRGLGYDAWSRPMRFRVRASTAGQKAIYRSE